MLTYITPVFCVAALAVQALPVMGKPEGITELVIGDSYPAFVAHQEHLEDQKHSEVYGAVKPEGITEVAIVDNHPARIARQQHVDAPSGQALFHGLNGLRGQPELKVIKPVQI